MPQLILIALFVLVILAIIIPICLPKCEHDWNIDRVEDKLDMWGGLVINHRVLKDSGRHVKNVVRRELLIPN
jgi:hypothetical protein